MTPIRVLITTALLLTHTRAQIPELPGAQARVYKQASGVELRLHVFRPDGWKPQDRRPAVVFFFGGGWTSGTPQQFAPHGSYLAQRGLVAISAEYRVKRRGDATPFDCVTDGKSAVRWIRAHAAELGIDGNRIAAAGGSAGGHVAACTSFIPGFDDPEEDAQTSSRPDALILFNPVVDTGPGGYGHGRLKNRYREISPVHHVTSEAPPTIVLHGDADKTVPVSNVIALRDAISAAGGRCDLHLYSGRAHGFFNARPGSMDDYVTTVRAMDRFLTSLGWLSGPPTIAPEGARSWHGYTRRDTRLNGRQLIVVEPDRPAVGRPWIWRARFFGHEPQTDLALLARGFHLVYADVANLYGNDDAIACWDACYAHVTSALGLAKKAALECMSRGGLIAFRWAARHPDRVACIYADAAVCDIRSWPGGKGNGKGHGPSWQQCLRAHGLDDKGSEAWLGDPVDQLKPLAKAGIPMLHVCGDADDVVPMEENARVVERRYRALGGPIRVIAKPGGGHHPHSLRDPAPIVGFILRHTVGSGDWFMLRNGLENCRSSWRENKRGRVAFLGGSITHNPGWRDQVSADLGRRFPETAFEFVNAGIPSFGSTPGAFRLGRDVFAKGPIDLLFVEAAVNDSTNGRTEQEMLRGMEGIIRHARTRNPNLDVVMLHFVDPSKMGELGRGVVPAVIRVHERVAERYGVPSLDLALEVTARIDAGEFTWKDDFKNLHPSPFGQKLYATSIGRLFDAAWARAAAPAAPHSLPGPLDAASYSNGQLVPVAKSRKRTGWSIDPSWTPTDRKGTRAGFVRVPMLVGGAPGATCELPFSGRAVGVLVTAGPDAGVIESRVDGGPWRRTDLFTRWSRGLHLPWSHVLHTDLERGPHVLEMRLAKDQPDRGAKPVARVAWFLVDGSD